MFNANCIEDRTALELAKTILHEGIHAELYRVVKPIGGYESLGPDNYPEIWEAYREHKDWSHNYMADYYLDRLAEAISNYDSHNYSMDHYIALAWQGLGEDPNNPSVPLTERRNTLSASERDNIISLRNELIENSNPYCP